MFEHVFITYFSVLLLSFDTRSTTSNQASGGLDIGRPKQSYNLSGL